ncbi:MAG: XRE family transcriptional regulator [Bacillota bacterium]
MIGDRFRMLRQSKKMSIKEVAEKSGLTSSFISQIERGLSGVSLYNLRDLCKAIDVPFYYLFLEETTGHIVRKNERVKYELPNSPVKYEILSPRRADIKIEQLLLNLEAGNENSMQPMAHFGEEIALILNGTVGVELNGNVNELNSGDCIQFQSEIPHRYINLGQSEAQILITVTPPSY